MVKLPLMVETAFMKDSLSKRDLLSKTYHRLSRSDTAVGFSMDTRRREMRSSQLGVTYDPKSHVDKRLQFRVLSVCSWAGTKEMSMTEIIGLLRNDYIDGKFDPDDSRKRNSILDLFLNKDEPLAMEEYISKYIFSAHWMKSFEELKLYKEKNGDFCDLHGTLGTWVRKQRSFYKKNQESKDSPLNQHRIDLLNSIGFNWTIHVTWGGGYEELKLYEEKNGDCCVPQKHETLGTWVRDQRSFYKKNQESKESPLNQHLFSQPAGISHS